MTFHSWDEEVARWNRSERRSAGLLRAWKVIKRAATYCAFALVVFMAVWVFTSIVVGLALRGTVR